MANLIPVHKAEIKRIISNTIWQGKTFAQYESEGFNHILKYWTNKPDIFPSIQIIHFGQTTQVIDTAENYETNIYQIRIAENFQTEDFENTQTTIEELISLLIETLANNQNKTNSLWEDLRIIKTGEYQSASTSTIVFREIQIEIFNTKTRTPSYV